MDINKINSFKEALEKFNLVNNQLIDQVIVNDSFQKLVCNLEDQDLFNEYLVKRHLLLHNVDKVNDCITNKLIVFESINVEKLVVKEEIEDNEPLEPKKEKKKKTINIELKETEKNNENIIYERSSFWWYLFIIGIIFIGCLTFAFYTLSEKDNKLNTSLITSVSLVVPIQILCIIYYLFIVKKNRFVYEMYQDGYIVSRVRDKFKVIIIPNKYKKRKIIGIKEDAFKDLKHITKVYISRNIIFIGDRSFNGCTKLSRVYFSRNSNLKEIGMYAFSNCESLKEIRLPVSTCEIGHCAFLKCKSLTKVVSFDNITKLGAYSFSYCIKLKEITIPKNIKVINKFAFSHCVELKSIKFYPDSCLRRICEGSFTGCIKLKKVILPTTLTKIDKDAFSKCVSLDTVVFDKFVSHIGVDSFNHCGLKSINIPGSIEEIGDGAFYNNPNLKVIIIRTNNKDFLKDRNYDLIFGFNTTDVKYISRNIKVYILDEYYKSWVNYFKKQKDSKVELSCQPLSKLLKGII